MMSTPPKGATLSTTSAIVVLACLAFASSVTILGFVLIFIVASVAFCTVLSSIVVTIMIISIVSITAASVVIALITILGPIVALSLMIPAVLSTKLAQIGGAERKGQNKASHLHIDMFERLSIRERETEYHEAEENEPEDHSSSDCELEYQSQKDNEQEDCAVGIRNSTGHRVETQEQGTCSRKYHLHGNGKPEDCRPKSCETLSFGNTALRNRGPATRLTDNGRDSTLPSEGVLVFSTRVLKKASIFPTKTSASNHCQRKYRSKPLPRRPVRRTRRRQA